MKKKISVFLYIIYDIICLVHEDNVYQNFKNICVDHVLGESTVCWWFARLKIRNFNLQIRVGVDDILQQIKMIERKVIEKKIIVRLSHISINN